MNELTFDALLVLMDVEVRPAIRAAIKKTKATHVVLFECQQMDSSHLGERTVLCVGPTCSRKTPQECEGQWLRDLPSERQYPVSWAAVPHYEQEGY